VIAGLVTGLAGGLGVFLVARGLVPAPPPLAAALDGAARAAGGGVAGRLPAGAVRRLGAGAGVPPADLLVLGMTPEAHAVSKLAVALTLAASPVVAASLAALGGVSVPLGPTALASLVGGPAGLILADVALRSRAAQRRADFRHALSAYLDLVVIVVAGGGGVESALHDAVRTGRGWAFAELGRALEGARLAGESPWTTLGHLASQLDLPDLAELAATVGLAGEQGARVRASLGAKAASLRAHELAETEAEAQSATEKMAMPVVLMLFGFLTFVGYPAVHRVLVGL
jgi:Flp pilus assembly protein TadB